MDNIAVILLLALLMLTAEGARGKKTSSLQDHLTFTSSWAVELIDDGKETADDMAVKHCFKNMGKIQVSNNIMLECNIMQQLNF